MLVKREQIDTALREMKMDAQGLLIPVMTKARSITPVFLFSSVNVTGGKSLAIAQSGGLETTLTKLAYAQLATQTIDRGGQGWPSRLRDRRPVRERSLRTC